MRSLILWLAALLGFVQARPTSVPDGQRLYDQACVSCHGPAGQGDRGPALNRGTFVHGNEDGDLFRTIRAGVPGTEMPPFARLTDEQVWQLVSYIRSLGRPDAPPASVTSISADATAGEGVFF